MSEWDTPNSQILQDNTIIIIIDSLTRLAQNLSEIIAFQDLNLTALRKILKKFDKAFNALENP